MPAKKNADVDEVQEQMEQMNVQVVESKDESKVWGGREPPLKPEEVAKKIPPGKVGPPTNLICNLFPIAFKPKFVYRYLVSFQPDIDQENHRQRRFAVGRHAEGLNSKFGLSWEFDGVHIVACTNPNNFSLSIDHAGQENSIACDFAKAIPTDDVHSQEVQMIANVMSKKLLRKVDLIQFNRSFYNPKPIKVQNFNLKLFEGFDCSIKPTTSGLQFCVNLTHRVMQERTIREEMCEIEAAIRQQGGNPAEMKAKISEKVNITLRNKAVICLYNNRIWRITKVDYEKSLSSTFWMEREGKESTFRDYFHSKYDIPLHQLSYQGNGLLVNVRYTREQERALKANPRLTDDELPGLPPKVTYIMPELCHMTGMTDEMFENDQLRRALADITRHPPSERLGMSKRLMNDIVAKKEVKEIMNSMPIALTNEPLKLQGRLLDPFTIEMKQNKCEIQTLGNKDFGKQIRDEGFILPAQGKIAYGKWAFVYEQRDYKTAEEAARTFVKLSQAQGGPWSEPLWVEIPAGRGIGPWDAALNGLCAKGPEFIVILIHDGVEEVYSFVKHTCAIKYGIVSQCLNTRTLRGKAGMMAVCGNAYKQAMAKMGHAGWKISFNKSIVRTSRKPWMIIGVDVSHDKKIRNAYGPPMKEKGSCVGFCASYDATFTQYHSYTSTQGKFEEYVRESKMFMGKALDDFKTKNGMYPEHIMVYRDGVGDSQVEAFVRKEVGQYQSALDERGLQRVKMTVICVMKRLQERLFVECPFFAKKAQKCNVEFKCNGSDAFHSPLPGTCVDQHVVSPFFSEFLLVPSKAPPRATATPTKFIILRDDNNFAADDIQNLSHQLCYMYSNWNGPIRVPSPVMYAHKIAYLYGKYLNGYPNERLKDKLHQL